ncbi:L10-interacting myb domain-containing protein [Thalictrum thalictroides]|uniref:L10-interacting myb domain-containing protein n=1 Tax=Thalictrum thalictroides TaxID=46969 RepID=A0A7J6VA91_THATH|nr:L10-interacting myb domain-containing protein [Thalictrum thalictroides]
MSSQRGESSQMRANWSPKWHKLFVDICLKQVKKGNKPKTHLNKQGWKELCQEFSTITGLAYDKKQLKNHWDYTRDGWKAWHNLLFNIGTAWDPVTEKIDVSDDFWDDYIRKNPSAARFRHQKLPHCQELDYIYGGTTVIGELEWTRSSDVAESSEQGPVQTPVETGQDYVTPDVAHELQQQSSNDVGNMPQSTPIHINTPTPQGVKRKRVSDVREIENMLGKLVDSVESKSRTSCTLDTKEVNKEYTIKDCVGLLNQMPDVPIGSEFYLDALEVFKKKSNREFFVTIPSEARFGWLQRQTRT